jgi:hypothetical protein
VIFAVHVLLPIVAKSPQSFRACLPHQRRLINVHRGLRSGDVAGAIERSDFFEDGSDKKPEIAEQGLTINAGSLEIIQTLQ